MSEEYHEPKIWYAVKSVHTLEHESDLYRYKYCEVCVLVRGASYEEAFNSARALNEKTGLSKGRAYVGQMDAFPLYDEEIEEGTTVWSQLRASESSSGHYRVAFYESESEEESVNERGFGWYAVRWAREHPAREEMASHLYEEEVMVFEVDSIEEAFNKGRLRAKRICELHKGVIDCGVISITKIGEDIIGHGTELWQKTRYSNFGPSEYVGSFVDTGREVYDE